MIDDTKNQREKIVDRLAELINEWEAEDISRVVVGACMSEVSILLAFQSGVTLDMMQHTLKASYAFHSANKGK